MSLALWSAGTGGVSVLLAVLGLDAQWDLATASVVGDKERVAVPGEGGRQLQLGDSVQDEIVAVEFDQFVPVL